jgi:hypothetical protein
MSTCKTFARAIRQTAGEARRSSYVFTFVFVAAALLTAVGQQFPTFAKPGGDQQLPVRIGEREIEDHRIGKRPVVHINVPGPRAVQLAMEGAIVVVTVDYAGLVTAASADDSLPSEVRLEAEAAARGLKYRPFERSGHTVSAKFEEHVGVFPPNCGHRAGSRFLGSATGSPFASR